MTLDLAHVGITQVTQTLLYDPSVPEVPGNCLQAAMASLLNLPLDAVPHFALFEAWSQAVRLWLAGRDLVLKSDTTDVIPDRPCIVHGMSVRGVRHAVVGAAGSVVWDPHPSRAGLLDVRGIWWLEERPENGAPS